MNQLDRYTCEQAFERLDDYLDRELSPEETRRLDEHLEVCEACAGLYRFQRSTIDQLKDRLRDIKVPSDLMSKLSGVLDKADSE